MKKLLAILLAVTMLASMATIASAESTTTLTTTVPAATYTLNIPANQEIEFGKTSTNIGVLTVEDEAGFAKGKDLKITITYSDFTCTDVSTTIPINIAALYEGVDITSAPGTTTVDIPSGDSLLFSGTSNGSVTPPKRMTSGNYTFQSLLLKVNSEDWGKALAGEYTATITFTAEVVAE